MADFLLIDQDQVIFNPNFGAAMVVVQPATISGNAKETLNAKKICIQGDEKNVVVNGCMYTTAIHSVAGMGVLKIKQLSSNQIAQKKFCGDKAVLLKGGTFIAVFQVEVPAIKPSIGVDAPVPDSITEYSGSGRFITSNIKWQAE